MPTSKECVCVFFLYYAVSQVPDNYDVLFIQGGASMQFAAIPLNLLRGKTSADYLEFGVWAQKAREEVKRYIYNN